MSIDTKALRELLAKATPTPWLASKGCEFGLPDTNAIYHYPHEHHCVEVIEAPAGCGEDVVSDADTVLIAAAITALPALLDAADRLDKIERLAETGTAQAFDALSDYDKLRWFAITGQRDKWARERLAELEAENKRLREALEWYAHPVLPYAVTQFHEPRSAVHADGGHRARKALAAGGEE